MKETEIEFTEVTVAGFGTDEAARLREISELIRNDMLRYSRTIDAEEEVNDN